MPTIRQTIDENLRKRTWCREKVLGLKVARDEAALLGKDVESAQRAYDGIIARINQTSLESQTTQSNVNVLTQATPPLEHAFPKVWLNLLLAVGWIVLAIKIGKGFSQKNGERGDQLVRLVVDLPAGDAALTQVRGQELCECGLAQQLRQLRQFRLQY